MKSMDRKIYISYIRVFAMIMVICNHCWGYFSVDNFSQYIGTELYYVDLVINSFTRCNVPLFLMISGSLMLGNEKYNSIENCIKKSIGIVKLLAFWIPLYVICNYVINDGAGFNYIIKYSMMGLWGAQGYYGHLWYLYVAILLYLITPLLNRFINEDKLVNYFLVLWFIFSLIYSMLDHYIVRISFADYLNLNLCGGYAGYYVLGYKLSKMQMPRKKTIVCGIVGGWCSTFIAVSFISRIIGNDMYFQNFMSPFIAFFSGYLFLLFRYGDGALSKMKVLNKITVKISELSLGVYLIHFILRDVVSKMFEMTIGHSYIYIIVSPLLVLMASIGITTILSKTKIINRYIISI